MMIKGSELSPRLQREVLARYAHRYTGDHKPQWAKNRDYPVQFASDADWLAHTFFAITKKGELNKRVRYCQSEPTWPTECAP